jgi:transposase
VSNAISPKKGPVQVHGNAKLDPSTRLLLVRRVVEEDWKVADAAAAQAVSERTVYRWLARWRAGDTKLCDRSSAPKRVPRRTPGALEALIERPRRLRKTSTRIAAELGMAVSTVGAVLRRLGLHRLSRLEPPEPPNRYDGDKSSSFPKQRRQGREPKISLLTRCDPSQHPYRGTGAPSRDTNGLRPRIDKAGAETFPLLRSNGWLMCRIKPHT